MVGLGRGDRGEGGVGVLGGGRSVGKCKNFTKVR